ncbi:MAG: GAF domain-containing protein, partial [Paracoccaceae bacterium]
TGMRMDAAEHFSARAIVSGEVVQIADIATSQGYLSGEPTVRILVEDVGVRTILSVPMFDAQGAIGAISLQRREERPFSDDEIALIQSFAAQAVIAIENVRQFRELQTRLAREAATREILEVISQSRDDDAPVFEVVLRKAADLCHASLADLNIVSEDRSHAVMVAAWGEMQRHYAVGAVWPLESDIAAAICMREGRVMHVHDLADSDLYRSGEPIRVTAVDVEGIRTFLAVPLFSGGTTVGCIAVYRREVKPFSPDEIALVETFAAQAVIAIENVRQFRELQTRLEREAATRDILEVISQSRDDDGPVFEMIAQSAARLCGAAICTFWRVENGLIHYCASHGLGNTDFEDTLLTPKSPSGPILDNTLIGQVVKTRAVARIEDGMAESYHNHEWARAHGLRQFIGVPIFVADNVWGSINLMWRADRAPRDTDIQLVESFAAQASIAIENVRQFKALEALNAELGDRVHEQVGEIERMGRLKRFLPSAVADAVVSSGSEKMLKSHRALLGVLFCDIRGFTAFCETAEPEETIEVLQTYHEEMGRLIETHGAGVDHRMGDGIMVLFNDPVPCDDPAGAAVGLAVAMRARMAELCAGWKKMGYRLGFGVGISLGYATVGMVGSGGRQDYTASGTAVNLAARLCDEAADGEILLSPRAQTAVEGVWAAGSMGERSLKGIREPVEIFRIEGAAGA